MYGSFGDYFHEPELTCKPAEDAYDPLIRQWVGRGKHWDRAPHLYMHRGHHEFIDQWILERYIDIDSYQQLPTGNAHEPLPMELTTPQPVYDAFKDLHIQFQRVWRPKAELEAMVQSLTKDLHLDLKPSKRAPVIGCVSDPSFWALESDFWSRMHYRGGDKLKKECTFKAGCGNSTRYLTAALETSQKLKDSFCYNCKPVLALMTIEPDAYDLFAADPLSEHFDIQLLPPPPSIGLMGHRQDEFNAMARSAVVESTLTMLRDITVLSVQADAFIVTASSNVGRVAIMLGGPNKLVRSIDRIFQPTTRQVMHYVEPDNKAFNWRRSLEEPTERRHHGRLERRKRSTPFGRIS